MGPALFVLPGALEEANLSHRRFCTDASREPLLASSSPSFVRVVT